MSEERGRPSPGHRGGPGAWGMQPLERGWGWGVVGMGSGIARCLLERGLLWAPPSWTRGGGGWVGMGGGEVDWGGGGLGRKR